MKKHFLISVFAAVAFLTTTGLLAAGAKATAADHIGFWVTLTKAKVMLIAMKADGGAPDIVDEVTGAQKSLDEGFKDAIARAKGKSDLTAAVKEFYLAASGFYRDLTPRKKTEFDSAADKLEMEVKLSQ